MWSLHKLTKSKNGIREERKRVAEDVRRWIFSLFPLWFVESVVRTLGVDGRFTGFHAGTEQDTGCSHHCLLLEPETVPFLRSILGHTEQDSEDSLCLCSVLNSAALPLSQFLISRWWVRGVRRVGRGISVGPLLLHSH